MEHYFFDLHFEDEQVLDEVGVDHFDAGSALYYGQRIADSIGRDADYRAMTVRVRARNGAVIATLGVSGGRGCERTALMGR